VEDWRTVVTNDGIRSRRACLRLGLPKSTRQHAERFDSMTVAGKLHSDASLQRFYASLWLTQRVLQSSVKGVGRYCRTDAAADDSERSHVVSTAADTDRFNSRRVAELCSAWDFPRCRSYSPDTRNSYGSLSDAQDLLALSRLATQMLMSRNNANHLTPPMYSHRRRSRPMRAL
jgi:hypothetical protein